MVQSMRRWKKKKQIRLVVQRHCARSWRIVFDWPSDEREDKAGQREGTRESLIGAWHTYIEGAILNEGDSLG